MFKAEHYILSMLDRWETVRPMDLGEINGALWKNILLRNEMLAAQPCALCGCLYFYWPLIH